MSTDSQRYSKNRLVKWGLSFIGRVPEAVLRDDLGYVDFGEPELAFECVVAHIGECEAPVSITEYREAVDITQGWPEIEAHLEILRSLIQAQ